MYYLLITHDQTKELIPKVLAYKSQIIWNLKP